MLIGAKAKIGNGTFFIVIVFEGCEIIKE